MFDEHKEVYLFSKLLVRVQLIKIRERLTRASLVLSPTFNSLFLDSLTRVSLVLSPTFNSLFLDC
ncbi:Uncharacterised protein [Streptococcus acidominimus]|uniref:Uncharacterized protein n=1 Tax=Streptococcus acidominimus TaxID=1326 RepID=A0A380IDH9_STRAI|nr:Uncharacterised protein [Streptococcus acidominimus]